MTINKLIFFLCGLMGCIILSPETYAQYFVVCGAPSVHFISSSSRYCHIKKHHHKVKHKHKRKRHHCPRTSCHTKSAASIAIYNVWDSFPAACSCEPCQNCTPCSYCPSAASSSVYITSSYAPVLDNNPYDFDFDRRTADDIGSDLNIDY